MQPLCKNQQLCFASSEAYQSSPLMDRVALRFAFMWPSSLHAEEDDFVEGISLHLFWCGHCEPLLPILRQSLAPPLQHNHAGAIQHHQSHCNCIVLLQPSQSNSCEQSEKLFAKDACDPRALHGIPDLSPQVEERQLGCMRGAVGDIIAQTIQQCADWVTITPYRTQVIHTGKS